MTERLTALLHAEADGIDVPAPPAGPVLARGRAIRRRRRVTTAVAAAAVLGVIGGGAALVADGVVDGVGTSETHVTATDRYLNGGAYAIGSTVYFGDPGNDPVTLDEMVKALYYTADGLVVRTGRTPWTDDSGPSHYSLVTPSGDVRRLDLDLGDRLPATDPEGNDLVYADGRQGAWEIVVRDVTTDTEVKRIPIEGSFTWGGWEAPPVALAGGTAYVGMDRATLVVDLATGESRVAEHLGRATMPTAHGGRSIVSHDDTMAVVDLATSETLLELDQPRGTYGELSPDGRYLQVIGEEEYDENGDLVMPEPGFAVYDVGSGDHVRFGEDPWEFGWTPNGHLLRVTRSEVTLCDPDTGSCTTEEQAGGKGEIKIAGNDYES